MQRCATTIRKPERYYLPPKAVEQSFYRDRCNVVGSPSFRFTAALDLSRFQLDSTGGGRLHSLRSSRLLTSRTICFDGCIKWAHAQFRMKSNAPMRFASQVGIHTRSSTSLVPSIHSLSLQRLYKLLLERDNPSPSIIIALGVWAPTFLPLIHITQAHRSKNEGHWNQPWETRASRSEPWTLVPSLSTHHSSRADNPA